uniref:Uncharacterized protein n=1 Tax=Parascaris equorum TaxID=6256 RepID=A0A914SEX8_PAREQ
MFSQSEGKPSSSLSLNVSEVASLFASSDAELPPINEENALESIQVKHSQLL